MLHALGFSTSLFAFYRDRYNRPLTPRDPITQLPSLGWYRDKNGSIYQWSDRVVCMVNRTWLSAYGTFTKLAHIVILPTVRNVARAFFECPTLDGVELEDENEAGVYLTHWEKRILENELMTATFTNSYHVSPITLAMMEDTGWYLANYSMSQSSNWGRGRGCLFAMASCMEYMLDQRKKNRSIGPFCDQLQSPANSVSNPSNRLQVSCTPDGQSYGFCNLIEHTKKLPKQYVYFTKTNDPINISNWDVDQRSDNLIGYSSNTIIQLASKYLTNEIPFDNIGGKIALANYCPYYQEIEWTNDLDEVTTNTHCRIRSNTRDTYLDCRNCEHLCDGLQHSGRLFHSLDIFVLSSGEEMPRYLSDMFVSNDECHVLDELEHLINSY